MAAAAYYPDDDDESNYSYADEADEMRAERDVFERVAPFYDRAAAIGGTTQAETIRDPTQRFILYVKGIASSMVNDERLVLAAGELNALIDYIRFVDDAKYKNPVAFVVAYDATRATRGRDIDYAKINRIMPYVVDMHASANVRDIDIVRYCRLWKRIFERA